MGEKTVFSTKWFDVFEKKSGGKFKKSFYGLRLLDYVSIVSITKNNEILLVKQYRPLIEKFTLELPSGHVEKGAKPEQAAKNELFEETGYVAKNLELLGILNPDVGRLTNKMWGFLATDIFKDNTWVPEKGIEVVKCPINDISVLVKNNQFNHALNLAILYLAEFKGILFPK